MKTNIFIFTTLFISLIFSGCKNDMSENLDQYATILYFRNNGLREITLYNTSTEIDYEMVIIKAGYNTKSTPSVFVELMSNVQLDVYNDENYTDYFLMPQDCYTIKSNSQIDFQSSQQNSNMKLSFNMKKLLALDNSKEYVIPFKLIGDIGVEVNPKKNVTFIKPIISIPNLSFGKFKDNSIVDESSENIFSTTLPVVLPIENIWEFDVTLETSQDILNKYNEENGTAYRLMPKKAYSYDPLVKFIPGTSAPMVNISVDKSQLGYGKFAIPIKISSCSSEAFAIDETKDTYVLLYTYTSTEKAKLIKVNLSDSKIKSNAGSNSASNGYDKMIDGNVNTYFKSKADWPSNVYIDFELPTDCNKFFFNFTSPPNTGDGIKGNAKGLKIYTSADGINYSQLDNITDGLLTGNLEEYESNIYSSVQKFRFVRIESTGNNDPSQPNYISLAEFEIYADLPLWGDLHKYPLTTSMLSAVGSAGPGEGWDNNDYINKERMLDGNTSTYFQTKWNYDGSSGAPDLKIELPQPCSVFGFKFMGYNNKSFEACPTKMDISVSIDGSTWTSLLVTTDNLPVTTAKPWYTSPIFYIPLGKYKYIRIQTLGTPSNLKFYAFVEFELWTL